jgi:hypothetical protein
LGWLVLSGIALALKYLPYLRRASSRSKAAPLQQAPTSWRCFEVGELPDSDAVLLLVVQRHDAHSQLMSFQSFAFPMNPKGSEAHVAVIDASTYLPKANLKIRDHPADFKQKPHEEELIFNRIYALDSGNYDVSVDKAAFQSLALESEKDYVILRTGDSEVRQALVAYFRIPSAKYDVILFAFECQRLEGSLVYRYVVVARVESIDAIEYEFLFMRLLLEICRVVTNFQVGFWKISASINHGNVSLTALWIHWECKRLEGHEL